MRAVRARAGLRAARFAPEFRVPSNATDAQVDAIAQILKQVFEVGGQDSEDDELYFGPSA